MSDNISKLYHYIISRSGRIGPAHYQKINTAFPTFELLKKARKDQFVTLGFSQALIESLFFVRDEINVEKEISDIEQKGVLIITQNDVLFPKKLENITDKPYILFAKGDMSVLNQKGLAVVGSRKHTQYGKYVTQHLVTELSPPLVIYSGLAYGIDTIAHVASIRSGGKTVAVLGSGILSIYPRVNTRLSQEIVESGGLLLSEFHPFLNPQRYHFPMRNRIISALSDGVLVTEASLQSGTLHTVNHALAQGREVFAIPGAITNPMSEGPNMLIKVGARPVTTSRDILEFWGQILAEKKQLELTVDEKSIIFSLRKHEGILDEVLGDSGMDVNKAQSLIGILCLKGVLTEVAFGEYTINGDI